jgi:hypothetical protein
VMTNDRLRDIIYGADNDAELLACYVDVFIGNGRLFRLAAGR